ncbi:MAG TPA: microviridin/marinostatin family tricyclic proteinase inhibitor [Blastocatellia bacterium]|nr:microviridin/marinostatin family tricyclic proteinase inhibitor [Blastocatellia bacterium]
MKETNELPFFARFLEGQEFPQVKTNIKAGRTLKYPSDSDEQMDVTQKFPSDGDEGGDSV